MTRTNLDEMAHLISIGVSVAGGVALVSAAIAGHYIIAFAGGVMAFVGIGWFEITITKKYGLPEICWECNCGREIELSEAVINMKIRKSKLVYAFVLICILLMAGCIECSDVLENESVNDYVSLTVHSQVGVHDGITSYYVPKTEQRTYYCADVAEDYWRYPSSYDKAFNRAHEYCIENFPEMFEREETPYNESHFEEGIILIHNATFSFGDWRLNKERQDLYLFRTNITLRMLDMECEIIPCADEFCYNGYCNLEQCMECVSVEVEK